MKRVINDIEQSQTINRLLLWITGFSTNKRPKMNRITRFWFVCFALALFCFVCFCIVMWHGVLGRKQQASFKIDWGYFMLRKTFRCTILWMFECYNCKIIRNVFWFFFDEIMLFSSTKRISLKFKISKYVTKANSPFYMKNSVALHCSL